MSHFHWPRFTRLFGNDLLQEWRKIWIATLALAGCNLSDVVKTTVWLKHAEDFAGFNAAYAPFFPENPPARSTAESRLMIDIVLVAEEFGVST